MALFNHDGAGARVWKHCREMFVQPTWWMEFATSLFFLCWSIICLTTEDPHAVKHFSAIQHVAPEWVCMVISLFASAGQLIAVLANNVAWRFVTAGLASYILTIALENFVYEGRLVGGVAWYMLPVFVNTVAFCRLWGERK